MCEGWPGASRDGAQMSATPVVPCAQLSTGQPPSGGWPGGIEIVPDTAVSRPARVLEW